MAAVLSVAPLSPLLGGRVNISAAEAATAPQDVIDTIASALREHLVVLLRQAAANTPCNAAPSPTQLRQLYTRVHNAMGLECTLPEKAAPAGADVGGHAPSEVNLRGACFPGFPETNVLGFAHGIEDWHGLHGFVEPAAWWERSAGQYHHDGGFSALSPPPPALVAMSCVKAPSRGGASIAREDSSELQYEAGATLFFSTKLALQSAPPEMARRARAMKVVYRSGFGQVEEGCYPRMSRSFLTSTTRSDACSSARSCPGSDEPDQGHGDAEGGGFKSLEHFAFNGGPTPTSNPETAHLYGADGMGAYFQHSLVQHASAPAAGGTEEFVMCHGLCMDHLVEEGKGPLSWEDSIAFVESLLGPVATGRSVLALNWRDGDVALWDNRQTLHSVTPSHDNRGRPGCDCRCCSAHIARLGIRLLVNVYSVRPLSHSAHCTPFTLPQIRRIEGASSYDKDSNAFQLDPRAMRVTVMPLATITDDFSRCAVSEHAPRVFDWPSTLVRPT